MAIAPRGLLGSTGECREGRRTCCKAGECGRDEYGERRSGEREERARLRGGSLRTGGRFTREEGEGGRWW